MSPLLIAEHEKNLIWPDNLDDPAHIYVHLDNIIDDAGDDHIVILEDVDDMARLYLRHLSSDHISANILLEFDFSAPEGFPERIPQVTSIYVGDEYRGVKLAQHVYRRIIEYYGVIVSDVRQTAGGMFIWLLMAEDKHVKLNIMHVRGNRLEYRMVDGKPEVYSGEINALEDAGATIWSGPDDVISTLNLERLGFRPTHTNMEHVVLAARQF